MYKMCYLWVFPTVSNMNFPALFLQNVLRSTLNLYDRTGEKKDNLYER